MHAPPKPPRPPLVSIQGDRLTLEFAPGNVQSEMRLSRPNALVLAYTRAMMCFALFVPRPRHIVMVGLGGGSMAKFCYRAFPQARITVLELRADVIALRERFQVPPDDARFRVLHADAIDYICGGGERADVILVDGYDADGMAPALGSSRFFGGCRRMLEDGGVLATNVFSYDIQFAAINQRLDLIFDQRVCRFRQMSGNNRILFAVRAPAAGQPGRPPRAVRVQQWVARHDGLRFGFLNKCLAWCLVRWLEHAH